MPETIVLEQFPFSASRLAADNKNTRKQRIYIMPTRHGLLFGLMLFAMLIGAINYNNSMAYILTFLLGSLSLVTILHTYRNLAGMVINEAPPLPVFSGELAKFPLILDNRNRHIRFAITFIRSSKKKWRLNQTSTNSHITTCNIDQNQLERIEVPVRSLHRGLLKAGRIKVYTIFPLGLFTAWSTIDVKQACLVYPKPEGQKSLPPVDLTESTGIQGKYSGTDDFTGFRNYQAGDSIKNIAWKVYAQQKGLFVKRFIGSGSDKLHLRWNDVSHLPDIESRLSQLCCWLIEAESQSLQYGLNIPEVSLGTGHGEKHLHLCLASLAKYGLKI